MIWTWLFTLIVVAFRVIFIWLPSVTALPTIGSFDMDAMMVSAVSTFKAFMLIFPPLGVIFGAFMFYMGFKILMVLLRILRIVPT